MNEWIKKAMEARKNAYAPYSKFNVGAALVCKDGAVYTGCNVENASFGLTNCAERTAFFKAISEGKRDFLRIVLVGGKEEDIEPTVPCGACLQVMTEFCNPEEFEIIMATSEEEYTRKYLKDLLPNSFSIL